MRFLVLKSGMFDANNYFLINEESGEAVIIDACATYQNILKAQTEHGFIVKYALITHAHFDHTVSCYSLGENGVKIYISEKDNKLLKTDKFLKKNATAGSRPFKGDVLLNGGGVLNLCGFDIKVIATPGHTAGSLCFLCGNKLFSGDTLFYNDIGRTDLPTGSERAIINSVKNVLFKLEGDYEVYPGHGESTTLDYERKNNGYVRG